MKKVNVDKIEDWSKYFFENRGTTYLYLKIGGLKLYLSLYFNWSASVIHWPMAYHKCQNINWD